MRYFAFILLFVLVSTACTVTKTQKKSLTGDLGSAEKVFLLEERVSDFWTAFVKEDYETVFRLYDPFFQARKNKYEFLGEMGKVLYHEFEIKDIKVEGNVAFVQVRVVYSVPPMMFKSAELSKPETPAEFEETWLYVYDNWYKEWYSEMTESGVAKY